MDEGKIELYSDSKKFGETLVKVATDEQRKKAQEQIVGNVRYMLEQLTVLRAQLVHTEKQIALYEKRIDATEKGEFSIDHNLRIIFNDTALQG